MAKKTKAETDTKEETNKSGEQLDLIEIHPKNAKPIIEAACLYKKHQRARMAAGAKEAEQKHKILELVREAKLQRLEDGRIKFRCDGIIVCITPQDEKVQIQEETDKGKS